MDCSGGPGVIDRYAVTELLTLFPMILSAALHWALTVIVSTWRPRKRVYSLFFNWLLIQSIWISAHALYWYTNRKIFSQFVGIVLPVAPATLVLFAMSYPNRRLPKWSYAIYLLAGLIWIPSQILGTAAVTGKQFAIFQMPCMLLFDALAGLSWALAYNREQNRRLRNGALLLLTVNLPVLFAAGLSYYISYFVIQIPTYLPWFGDLMLSLSSLQTCVILRLCLENVTLPKDRAI